MSLAGMRMTGPGCHCGCVVFRDGFSGADTKLNGVVGDYSGIPNRGSSTHPDQFWVITGGKLSTPKWDGTHITTLLSTVETTTLPSGPYRVEHLGTLPRNLRVTVAVRVPYESTKVRLVYQAISTGDPTQDRRYGLEIETSATVDSATDCGWVRLWDLTNLSSPVLLDQAKVIGLCGTSDASIAYTMAICFNPDDGVLNGYVTQDGSIATSWVHAFNQTSPSDIDASLSKIWMEVMNFPATYSGTAAAIEFDDLAVYETAKKYYYYYYYGGHAGNSCPCCGAAGCQTYFNDFSSGVIDCDFFTSGASVDVDGGKHFVKLPTSGNRIELLRSWSGVDSSCEPDKTMAVSASVRFHGNSKTVKLEVLVDSPAGNPYALFTSESAPSAGDGTIALYDGGGRLIDSKSDVSLPKDSFVGVALCYYDGYLVASTRGSVAEGEGGTNSSDGHYARITNQSGGSQLDVTDFYVTHDLYSNCPDCFGEELPGGHVPDSGATHTVSCSTFACSGNKVPQNLKLTMFNCHCAWQDDGHGGQIEWTLNGTTVIPFLDEYCSPYDFFLCGPNPAVAGPGSHVFASFDYWVRWSAIMNHSGTPPYGGTGTGDAPTTDTLPCGPEPLCTGVDGTVSPRTMAATPVAQIILGRKDGVNKVVLLIGMINTLFAFCLGAAYAVYEAELPDSSASGVDCLSIFDGGLHLQYVESFVCCGDDYTVGDDQFCLWSNSHAMLSR